ncbi:spermidine/putrescine ABC transporter substrate-binding protein [Lysinibacillus alkalisoli]|uniref:Spermidine/putrescine ABC transporter substrate-binding protein n=1 Tax=Lysinibacillus alkalisoli TaxID=1911548 RepID=A0A917G2W1_9BACI|nr:ABC transporter substrate-binding protein [Lysinibacillus alkalisoli]GGG20451.1 spermidine/putrescine ABC transporter substrate-binding protein [Lysinibacillus alkalisoli]
MKQLIQATIAILLISGALLYTTKLLNVSGGKTGKDILTIYNWGEYIDPDLLKAFEKETGIHVIYETFDTNEAMLTKIEQGGTAYDIAVPSEYIIEKMREDDLLIPIDHSKIPNLKNLDPYFLNLPFDPHNKYSIPYFWGTVGVVFNPEFVDGTDFDSWQDLWNPDFKRQVFLVDSAREVVGMGLNSLDYSLNSKDDHQLAEAEAKLTTLAPNVKAIIGDEITQLMVNNEAHIALTWSGQAADMLSENEALDYAVPQEGSNLWFDNIVIPKTSKNVEGAHQFINFMLSAEAGAQNADYVGYSTPNDAALALMDPEVVNDERFYPDEEQRDTLEVYKNLGPTYIGIYNELFLRFKMAIR